MDFGPLNESEPVALCHRTTSIMYHVKEGTTTMTAQPLVLDEVINQQPPKWQSRAPREEFLKFARGAERFVFSNSASKLLGQFSMECGDLVLHHRQFAIPPYDTVYIELSRPFFESFKGINYPDGTDTHVGYLLNHKRIYVMARGGKHGGPAASSDLMPWYYTWSLPGEVAHFDPKTRGMVLTLKGEGADWNKLAIAYGSSQQKISDEDERQQLLNQVQLHLFTDYYERIYSAHGENTARVVRKMLVQGAGDVRNVWAALLWLNRPAHTIVSNQPAGRRFFKGKQVAYRAHHTVEIDLHKHRSLRRAFVLSGERLSPRRHKVRGAFHHMHGSPGCSHEWPLLPDDDQHWTCTKCGRVRWWVKNHVRGDATRGWVDHDYSVTTGESVKEQGP